MSSILTKIISELNWMPSFDTSIDRNLSNYLASKYSFLCFLFFLLWFLILLPIFNYLSSNNIHFFKIYHTFRRFIKNNCSRLHRSSLYHNRSFKLCSTICFIIFFCSLYNTQSDLLQIAKRLGRIPALLLPITLFMTLKPSPLPNTLYLNLLPFHKWLSRSLVLFSLLHSILYFLYFAKYHVWKQRLFRLDNFLGILALALLSIIALSSLPSIRRLHYRFFYILHYISTWPLLITLHIHSRYKITKYTFLCLAILLYQIGYRFLHTSTVKPSITNISPNLTLLEFPISQLAKQPVLPASHIRLVLKSKNIFKRVFYLIVPLTHPFTLLNLPGQNTARLLIRTGNFPLLANHEYYVTGVYEPVINFISTTKNYGMPTRFPLFFHSSENSIRNPFQVSSAHLRSSPLHFFVDARRVLIFVGGSAISFGLPLLSVLNFNGVMVRLVWCVRDYRDVKILNYLKIHYYQGLEIFISGKSQRSNSNNNNNNNNDGDDDIKIDYYDYDHSCSTREDSQTSLLHEHNNRLKYIVDSINEDEIDFTGADLNSPLTKMLGSKNSSKNMFRKLQVIKPPTNMSSNCVNLHSDSNHLCTEARSEENDEERIKLPSFVKVSYGRPKLDDSYYEWCLQRECNSTGNLSQNTHNTNNINHTHSHNFNSDATAVSCVDNQCLESNLGDKDEEILSNVWVVAAGPTGLVKTTRSWANDCGLRFHGEEFTL